jgi:acyl-[acyl-carrier-protein] desaturase
VTPAPLLTLIEPAIESAYDSHMATPRGLREPIYPPTVLARAAETQDANGVTDRDPLSYGPVLRARFQEHVASFDERYGVDVRPVLAAAFLVNLLTEDNLPYYTHKNLDLAGASEALITWVHEWTAEEDAHGVLMRDYALLTGLIADGGIIEHATYAAGRTRQLRAGTEIDPPGLAHALAYLTLQELLTKEAHNALSWLLDASGRSVMRPISGDEHNHFGFYLALSAAALEADPDASLVAMDQVYAAFAMPGRAGIPDFDQLATTVGLAGIFDPAAVARSMRRIVERLDVGGAAPVSDAGRAAQASVLERTGERAVARKQALMERLRGRAAASGSGSAAPAPDGLRPFLLGVTIDFEYVQTVTGPRIVDLRAVPEAAGVTG